jgi:putative thioredoxin
MIDVTEQSFRRDVLKASQELPVLVEVWASWSAPACELGAILERIERDLAGAFSLVRIDAEDNSQLLGRLGVKTLPFCLLFKNGEPADGFIGTPREDTIRAFLRRHVARPVSDAVAEQARLAQAEHRHADAAAALRAMLAINPADRTARADYVRALLHLRQFEPAAMAFEPLHGRAASEPAVEVLATLIDAGATARVVGTERAARAAVRAATETVIPADAAAWTVLDARHVLAQWLLSEGRAAEAMEELLAILAADRGYRDGAACKTMLAAFEIEADQSLVAGYRRRMAAMLFN